MPVIGRRLAGAMAGLVGIGYAVLAVGSGLDRLSQTRPELASKVPAPFRSQALRQQARALLTAGKAPAALPLSAAAVANAPLEPESTALLGMARYLQGERNAAESAFRIAGQLGWREPLTQAYWLERAIAAGDDRVAALRIDALLRQHPQLLSDRRLLDPIETRPSGRAALAERLLARPRWLASYVTGLGKVPRQVLVLRAGVLGELAARKAILGCAAVGPMVERLVAESAEAEATRLWHQHCPEAARALINDGDLAAASLDQQRSSFAWTFLGQGDTNVLLEPDDAGRSNWLAIETTAPRPRMIARQMVLAPPGRYRLSWSARDADGASGDLIQTMLSCAPRPSRWQSGQLDPASQRWSSQFTLDGACSAHWLAFAAGGREGSVKLGAIRLELQGPDQAASPR
jgi:hypothetical protein